MKKTLITLAALAMASVASATNFYWDGGQGDNNYGTAYNWDTDAGNVQWLPTANDCDVYIGSSASTKANDGNVTYEGGLTLSSLTIGANSSLTVTEKLSTVNGITLKDGGSLTMQGWGDYSLNGTSIEAGSTLAISGAGMDIGGFDGTTTLNVSGALAANSAPMFTMTAGTFWGGDSKTIALTGTLDLSALPNSIGSVTLVDISASNWSGGLAVDYSNLTLTGAAYGPATLSWVGTKGGNGKLVLSYVPEPTTATLSLLALAGLAARRRRK